MYKNVGKKIMVLAQVLGWLLLIAGIIVGLVYLSNSYSGDDMIGVIALATGVVSFISSWFLYGFGQLVNDVNVIKNKSKNEKQEQPKDELPEL